MIKLRDFDDVSRALAAFVPPVKQPGAARRSLAQMSQLMAVLDNPQDRQQVIHVAGTSGKTSTCYYLAALLNAAGRKVGLTVSPHVDEVNERVQVDLTPLPEQDFCRELSEFLSIIENHAYKPSYFEMLVAFAYWEFARQNVEFAVVEAGMGGLLDATNVVRRAGKVCVITDIGLDHTEYLGSDLGDVAAQKAGIIQPGNTVYMYEQAESVMRSVSARCQQVGAELVLVSPANLTAATELPLFQQHNWHLAQSVVTHMAQRAGNAFLLNDAVMRSAQSVYVPARMEVFRYEGKTIIVDGSHNEQKLRALMSSIRQKYPNQSVAVLASFGKGDEARVHGGIGVLRELAGSFIFTGFDVGQDTPKAPVDPDTLAEVARGQGVSSVISEPDPEKAFKVLLARPEPILLVTGSFYLLNHIRPPLWELTRGRQ